MLIILLLDYTIRTGEGGKCFKIGKGLPTKQNSLMVVKKEKTPLMITRPIFEKFRQHFLDYFEDEVLTAEFDNDHNLIVFANPYVDYSELVIHICDKVAEIVYFRQRLLLFLYPFGSNESLSIRIN